MGSGVDGRRARKLPSARAIKQFARRGLYVQLFFRQCRRRSICFQRDGDNFLRTLTEFRSSRTVNLRYDTWHGEGSVGERGSKGGGRTSQHGNERVAKDYHERNRGVSIRQRGY